MATSHELRQEAAQRETDANRQKFSHNRERMIKEAREIRAKADKKK